MYLLMIVLKDENLIEEVLTALVGLEVVELFSIYAESLKHLLSVNVPIFAELSSEINADMKRNIIMGVIPDIETADHVNKVLRSVNGINFAKENIGFMLVLPITKVYGLLELGE